MSALAGRLSLRGRMPAIRITSGISAIMVKELRGRMRGRRAFVILTLHVLLLAAFAWMFERINEESIASMSSYGGQATYASASVGRGVFVGLLMLQTLMVAVLAPAATAGSETSVRDSRPRAPVKARVSAGHAAAVVRCARSSMSDSGQPRN